MLSGTHVKYLMLLKDITQQEIANYCNVKRNYISLMVNGQQNFTEEIYNKMIEYINLSKEKREQFKKEFKEKKSNDDKAF